METVRPVEIVFKQVGDLEIALDVYIPETASQENPAPVFLWWHGGGLLQGSRKALSPHHIRSVAKHGICLVSADFRLAPQTRLPKILSDVQAALDFLQSPEFAAATGNRVDSSKVVLSGNSAGGFLALLIGTGIGFAACGLPVPSHPTTVKAIVTFYPFTDLADQVWTTKRRPLPFLDRIIEEDELRPFLDPNGEETSFSKEGKRNLFAAYASQEGLLPTLFLEATGISPDAFSIASHLRSGQFTPAGPVYLAHGSADNVSPPSQSANVAAALKERGFPVEFDCLEGVSHNFDKDPKYEMEEMYAFVKKALGK